MKLVLKVLFGGSMCLPFMTGCVYEHRRAVVVDEPRPVVVEERRPVVVEERRPEVIEVRPGPPVFERGDRR